MDSGLLVGATDDEILRRYVDLVRTWRGAATLTARTLRQADVVVLVSILGTDAAEIERRLIAATKCTTSAAKRSRRLLLASVGALCLGLTGVTVAGTRTVAQHAASPARLQRAAFVVTSAAVVPVTTRPEPVAPTPAPVVAPQVPQPVVAPEPAPTTPTPPAGTEATVSVPSLGIDLPVIEGGQSIIDEGVVAHYTAAGWEAPVAAGAPGTYWLAAHHVTHGGPFEALPDITIGAEVRVTTASQTFVYTVTSKEVVDLLPGDAAVYGTDPSAAVILLQTCIDDTHRLLVHGILTAAR